MSKTTIYMLIAVGALAYWYKTKKATAGRDIGGGWVMNADGTRATGPGGREAMNTGYMTADPYPTAGQYSI